MLWVWGIGFWDWGLQLDAVERVTEDDALVDLQLREERVQARHLLGGVAFRVWGAGCRVQGMRRRCEA